MNRTTRTLAPKHGGWPPVGDLVGAEVAAVGLRGAPGELALVLEPAEGAGQVTLLIPGPWVYTSCLMSASSAEYANAGPEETPGYRDLPDLIGLAGARLTGVESDREHLDLVFGSLRLSVGESGA